MTVLRNCPEKNAKRAKFRSSGVEQLGGRRGVLGVLPALDTTFKLGEASVYVTHVSVYVTHGSCKRGDLPPQDAREGKGHRDVDRCERE